MQSLVDEIMEPKNFRKSLTFSPQTRIPCGCPECQQRREMVPFSRESMLDEILYDKFGNDYEWEVSERNTISSEDYIKWVQRSLNRILRLKLRVNGKVSSKYRTALRVFNKKYLNGRNYNDIDEVTQNKMIKLNQANSDYISWVQEALYAAGAKRTSIIPGQKDSNTKKNIKDFQGRNGLKKDGFVGAKTELAIIRVFWKKPPGESDSKPSPSPTPKPAEIKQKIGRKLLDASKMISKSEKNPIIKKRLRCLLSKLSDAIIDNKKIDDCYITIYPHSKLTSDIFKNVPPLPRCNRLIDYLINHEIETDLKTFSRNLYLLDREIIFPIVQIAKRLRKLTIPFEVQFQDASLLNTPECFYARYFLRKGGKRNSIYNCYYYFIYREFHNPCGKGITW